MDDANEVLKETPKPVEPAKVERTATEILAEQIEAAKKAGKEYQGKPSRPTVKSLATEK